MRGSRRHLHGLTGLKLSPVTIDTDIKRAREYHVALLGRWMRMQGRSRESRSEYVDCLEGLSRCIGGGPCDLPPHAHRSEVKQSVLHLRQPNSSWLRWVASGPAHPTPRMSSYLRAEPLARARSLMAAAVGPDFRQTIDFFRSSSRCVS